METLSEKTKEGQVPDSNRCPRCKDRVECIVWVVVGGENVKVCRLCAVEMDAADAGYAAIYTKAYAA